MTVTYNAALGGRTSLGVFTAAGAFTALSASGQVTSTVANGTAPLIVASGTKVDNLNADKLDGNDWAAPAALGSTTPANVTALVSVAEQAQSKKQLLVETATGAVPAVLATNFGKTHLHSHASDAPTYTLPVVTVADKGATLRFAKTGSGTITIVPPGDDVIDDSTVAVKATGYVNSDGTIPDDGDAVTINTTVYTFKTALTPTEGEVLIGGSAAVALDNLAAAINHTGTPGTDYSCAAAHTTVEATTNTDTRQTVVALAYGVAANSYPLVVTDANMSVSAATMASGVDAGTLSCSDAAPASVDLELMADGLWVTTGSSNTWATS